MYNEDEWSRETDDESFWSDGVEFQYLWRLLHMLNTYLSKGFYL